MKTNMRKRRYQLSSPLFAVLLINQSSWGSELPAVAYTDVPLSVSGMDSTIEPAGTTRYTDLMEFGAKGDCVTDDWPAFQEAEVAMSKLGGGTILVRPPERGPCYRIRQALRLQSNVTLFIDDPATTIRCTADMNKNDSYGGTLPFINRYPFSGCWMIGSYEGREYQAASTEEIEPISRGDRVVSIQPASESRSFFAGDLIGIESVSAWQISPGDVHPTLQEINRVEEVDPSAGTLRLLYPTSAALQHARLRRLTNNGGQALDFLGNPSGVVNWASWNSKIIGGRWIGRKEVPLSGGGGGLGDVLAPDTAVGFSLGVNLCGRCRIQIRHSETSGSVIELAYGTHDSRISIGRAKSDPPPPGTTLAQWYVAIDEGSRRNIIEICSHTFSASDAVKSEVGIISSSDNLIRIGTISGVSIRGPIVLIDSPDFAGVIKDNIRNSVFIGKLSIERHGPEVSFVGIPTDSKISENANATLPTNCPKTRPSTE